MTTEAFPNEIEQLYSMLLVYPSLFGSRKLTRALMKDPNDVLKPLKMLRMN